MSIEAFNELRKVKGTNAWYLQCISTHDEILLHGL